MVRKRLCNRTRSIRSDRLYVNETYKKLYGRYNYAPVSICKITLYPLPAVKFKIPKFIKNLASRYTVHGRYCIHEGLIKEFREDIKILIKNPLKGELVEKNDNRISLFVGQKGLCYVTKKELNKCNIVLRNKLPKHKGGTDKYHNLVLVNEEVNNLIDEINTLHISQFKEKIILNKKALNKINALRKLVGNPMI